MPCLSIIIPIYNAEEYLDQCLFSIQKQPDSSIEVIMVNDGSTDSSQLIIQQFLSDIRFKCLVQPNKGVSAARNLGIKHATGDFLLFVDSDDFLHPQAINRIVKSLKELQPEMLFFGYEKGADFEVFYKSNLLKDKGRFILKEVALKRILDDEQVFGFVWNKVFNADLIKKNNIFFKEDIHISEDLLFSIEATTKIQQSYIIHDTLYFHRLGHVSVFNSDFKPDKLSVIKAYSMVVSLLNEPSLVKSTRHKLVCILLPMARNNVRCLNDELSIKVISNYFKQVSLISFVLDKNVGKRYKLAFILALINQKLLRLI